MDEKYQLNRTEQFTQRVIRRQVHTITTGSSGGSVTTSTNMSQFSASNDGEKTQILVTSHIASPIRTINARSELEMIGGGEPIEPIDLDNAHTADELDRKRENERVYEYLTRLYEVRNWLVDILHTENIPEENKLEENLSNGIILARLANSFAPAIVPLSKIYDLDESRHKKDGKISYRHTDNIVLWKNALKHVHFPEIFVPDTVDIYQGKNVKTIFCLFTLARHLHRIRRGPAIRRELGEIQFSPTQIDDIRERLKVSDLSMFGDVDGIFSTTPDNIEDHNKAVAELNNCIDSKDSLLFYLRCPDMGILYVNERFINDYQSVLMKKKMALKSGEILNRQQIQAAINEVNDTRALYELEGVLSSKRESRVIELNSILDDLRQEDIIQNAVPIYTRQLHKARGEQNTALTIKQVEAIIQAVNACMRIRHYALQDNANGLFNELQNEYLYLKEFLHPELINEYKNRIVQEYNVHGQKYVLMPDVIDKIVRELDTKQFQSEKLAEITLACESNDAERLAESLSGVKGAREDLIIYYLEPLKRSNLVIMSEVELVIAHVNDEVAKSDANEKILEEIGEACSKNDHIGLGMILNQLKGARKDLTVYYMEAFKKAKCSTIEEVEDMIRMINESVVKDETSGMKVQNIATMCKNNDYNGLSKALEGVKDARSELVHYYLKILKKTEYTTIEHVSAIIARVNKIIDGDRESVEKIWLACEKDNESELKIALHDLKGIRDNLIPLYLNNLKQKRFRTIDEVEHVINMINEEFDAEEEQVEEIRKACKNGNLHALTETLSDVKCAEINLIPYYLKNLKNAKWTTMDQVEEIIKKTNIKNKANEERVEEIKKACRENNQRSLNKELSGLECAKAELMPYYLTNLKNSKWTKMDEVEEIIQKTNANIKANEKRVSQIIQSCNQDNEENLMKLLEGITEVKEELAPLYLSELRSRKYFTVDEIKKIILLVNESADNEGKITVSNIKKWCESDDQNGLANELSGLKNVRMELIPYYLKKLKDKQWETIDEMKQIIEQANKDVDSSEVLVTEVIECCERDDEKGLAKALVDIKESNEELIAYYLNALKNEKYVTTEEIVEIIIYINETVDEIRRKVRMIADACKKGDIDSLSGELKGVKGVKDDLMPLYLNALKNSSYNTMIDVEKIILQVDDEKQKDNVEKACKANDVKALAEYLKFLKDYDGCLISVYLDALKKAHISSVDDIEDVIRQVNSNSKMVANDKQKIEAIRNASEKGNLEVLSTLIGNMRQLKDQFLHYYSHALKNSYYTTMSGVEQIIAKVNNDVSQAEIDAKDTLMINHLLVEKKKDEAKKLLKKSWSKEVYEDLLPKYLLHLSEDISRIRQKIDDDLLRRKNGKSDQKVSEYLSESFDDGILYIDYDGNKIMYQSPELISEWMLTRKDIQNSLNAINESEKKTGKRSRMSDAARKIQNWYRRRLFYKDLKELRNSENPRLRVVRRFIPVLLPTVQDVKEDQETDEEGLYLLKLFRENIKIENMLSSMNSKIARSDYDVPDLMKQSDNIQAELNKQLSRKISTHGDQTYWNPYEIIFFYLQTNPELLSSLMAKYTNDKKTFSGLFERIVLPVFTYGASKREMTLLAILIRTYLRKELKKNDFSAFKDSQSSIVLSTLLRFHSGVNQFNVKLTHINQQMKAAENTMKCFNLNPEAIFESIKGRKANNVDEAMGDAEVARVINESINFLTHWAFLYADTIFSKDNTMPGMVKYIIESLITDIREFFPDVSDASIIQNVCAWLYQGCWKKYILTNGGDQNSRDEKEATDMALRNAISKFIEFGILRLGYGIEKYWLRSLNEAITKISDLSSDYITNTVTKLVPTYVYDKYEDIYGRPRPILYLTISQIRVTLQCVKTDVNCMIEDKNSELRKLIEQTESSTPLAEGNRYVVLSLHPFPPAISGNGNDEELFQRAKYYTEACLLSGCPGENLSLMLAHHTRQKEEEYFRTLPHFSADLQSLEDAKRKIVQNLSKLMTMGRVQSINNYQQLVNAIAQDINREHQRRRERRANLMQLRTLIIELEKRKQENQKQLNEAQKLIAQKMNKIRQSPLADSQRATMIKENVAEKSPSSLRSVRFALADLADEDIVLSFDSYENIKDCKDVIVEISETESAGMLLIMIAEPNKQSVVKTTIDFQSLITAIEVDLKQKLKIADKLTVNVKKFIDFVDFNLYTK